MPIALPTPRPSPLRTLLADVRVIALSGDLDVDVVGSTHDSRGVEPGILFTAYHGVNQDVHRYLPDALDRGAPAALVERDPEELRAEYGLPADARLVQVPDVRLARAKVAAALFGHPSRAMRVVGVTGTDGKTTTCTLIEAILDAAGLRTGLVTTVAARIGGEELDTGLHVTTPEPEDVQRYLAAMRDEGAEVAVLETTSHGLAQHRVGAVAFDVGVITNITHEALEYHRTFEAYRAAKSMLFHAVAEVAPKPAAALDGTFEPTAVLNADDDAYAVLSAIDVPRQLSYSVDPATPADIKAVEVQHDPSGLSFLARVGTTDVPIVSPLFGAYNVENMLAAIGAAHALGAPPKAWRDGIARVRSIPGRMERVDEGQAFTAVVDFAHTPNALESALSAARSLTGPGGRVIAVFGCAGLRDPSKRGPMGSAAGRHADLTLITAEDPRTEPLDAIIEQVAEGLRSVGAVEAPSGDGDPKPTFRRVPDRGSAIAQACEEARAGDIVMICGKGHEQSLCFGDVEYPWDDRSVLRAVLRGEPPPRTLPTASSDPRTSSR